jgi:protein gp37
MDGGEMSEKSSIEWTDATWNPITGCTKVSEGCKNCYAERIAKRFWKDRSFSDIKLFLNKLGEPIHWKKPRKIFVCSMSDLFHPNISDGTISGIWEVMQYSAPWHTYIVLTKRPERMRDILQMWECEGTSGVANNIWLGVTAENQKMADERIPILLETPAAVRFVSVEPMLGKIDLRKYLAVPTFDEKPKDGYPFLLDWVICGCESGSGARPFDWRWAQDLKNQCLNADVPFFYKQGRYDGKIKKLPGLDGWQWMEYPKE